MLHSLFIQKLFLEEKKRATPHSATELFISYKNVNAPMSAACPFRFYPLEFSPMYIQVLVISWS